MLKKRLSDNRRFLVDLYWTSRIIGLSLGFDRAAEKVARLLNNTIQNTFIYYEL